MCNSEEFCEVDSLMSDEDREDFDRRITALERLCAGLSIEE